MCLRPYLDGVEASLKRLQPSGKPPGTRCMLLGIAKNHDLAIYIFKNHALKLHASRILFEGFLCVLETIVEPSLSG